MLTAEVFPVLMVLDPDSFTLSELLTPFLLALEVLVAEILVTEPMVPIPTLEPLLWLMPEFVVLLEVVPIKLLPPATVVEVEP